MKKDELKYLINLDKKICKRSSIKENLYRRITGHQSYIIYKSIVRFRKYRYYKEKNNFLLCLLYGRKKNISIKKYQLELAGKLGKNLRIAHIIGGILINQNAVIGDNVTFHGNNLVGNNGKSDKAPIIGNNVDIGYGAMIIGNIKIADGIKIGANSVVTKSFHEENIVIAGCPAKKIEKREV